jgi:O-phospho-L-seryl-tRNASec:L-selenocysteinyl-tRNA synthase
VRRRHFGLAHGIGRSGDITAEQPKAAGSTLLARLCNTLAADALRSAGFSEPGQSTVLPVATGMALTLALLALAQQRPGARHVVWPRCDQRSCVKAVHACGLALHVVPNALEADQVRTDVAAVRAAVEALGAQNVVCVLSTTSCFAPRACDRLAELARLCSDLGCGHVVNNAYGVQSAALSAAVTAACRRGRVDCVVQSTDKNFCVPVGGAVVWSPGKGGLVSAINAAYPGRACMAPLLDLLMTLLHWGDSGWRAALRAREDVFPYLRERLAELASQHGASPLSPPSHPPVLSLAAQASDC